MASDASAMLPMKVTPESGPPFGVPCRAVHGLSEPDSGVPHMILGAEPPVAIASWHAVCLLMPSLRFQGGKFARSERAITPCGLALDELRRLSLRPRPRLTGPGYVANAKSIAHLDESATTIP